VSGVDTAALEAALAKALDYGGDYMPNQGEKQRGKDAAAVLLSIAREARDRHDEECGCEGEACRLGAALAGTEPNS
jgi:hypothetical protein